MINLGKTAAFLKKTAWDVWGEPTLTAMGLYEPADRSYGRCDIPFSPAEERMHAMPNISVKFRRVTMANGKDWMWYQVWEDKEAILRTGRKADLLFCHGTGVHSGTFASHARRYLDAGFRCIVPDLLSHGYSSGLHVYQRYINAYCEGLHLVLHDVAREDDLANNNGVFVPKAERHHTFILGLSFGGLLGFYYALMFPDSYREDADGQDEIPIDGIVGVGPMIDYGHRIPSIIQAFGWMIAALGGLRLELTVPHKKVLDKDPKVYKTLVTEDPRSHQGAFRGGHILCIRDAMWDIQHRAREIRHPIYAQQGGRDRVVSVEHIFDWIRTTGAEDRRMTVYPICQHVIYRKAKTEMEDQAGRICVLEDNLAWMCARSPAYGRLVRQDSMSSEMTLVNDVGTPNSYPTTPSIPLTPPTPFFNSFGENATIGMPHINFGPGGTPAIEVTIQSLQSQLPTPATESAPRAVGEGEKKKSSKPLTDAEKAPRVYRAEWNKCIDEQYRPFDLDVAADR
ncbi:hypothetical protein OC834_004887 [Tilletia horrida]|uniref:Serine aminopeptidase S33 domain-containing protein n=1 Tax=Tilletia horrida TaxID=155126 RepID=A0AAN6GGW7_9BASI|nr:hypothetical protein OC834_004887 [Tilletia horrida]KAK0540432.1 hypothetical protein OC842_000461 [Tilletia horrida]KAK0557422.1 hypothetical protein OC844_005574 [Tilletia horrida]